MRNTANMLTRVFYIIFAVCFTYVIVNIMVKNPYCGTGRLIVTAVCVFAALLIINMLFDRCEDFLKQRYKLILTVFLTVMFIIQLRIGISLRSDFVFDIGNINKGAWEWVETGSFKSFYYYFYFCPNNLAPMAFWYIFLKAASVFGITDYYAVTVLVMCVMISVTTALVSLILKKFCGEKCAVLALVIFAVNAPWYIMGAAVYTDAMTMMYPVLILYLYLLSKEKDRARDRVILYIIMGIVCAVGSMVKFTVLIMGIAVIIDMLLNKKTRRDSWKAAICFAAATVVFMSSFNAYIYARHMDRNEAYRVNKPYAFWVMMGLGGDGLYNQNDADIIADTAPEERQAKAVEVIKERVHERGAVGMFKFLTRKSVLDLGNGTFGLSDTINYTPLHETKLRDWVVDKSEHYDVYCTYSTGVHLALLAGMLILVWLFAFEKNALRGQILPVYLALFGLWFFLLMWETNKRYFLNFVPLIFICAVPGIDSLKNIISVFASKKTNPSRRKNNKRRRK